MDWLALDIGGANLKAADGRGFAASRFFPLWQRPDELADALAGLLAESPRADTLAITMTGELADCFATKAEGVRSILAAVGEAAGDRPAWVYLTDGRWASPQEAAARPLLAAAANWHALARFAGRYASGDVGLLVDVGSTTCDIIPLVHGRPTARGSTDPERLVWGELVYTGVQRSPVCAVVDSLPWRGRLCPTAQELFATTWDAYLVLGDLPEEPQSRHTADGRGATRQAAADRLARAICADRELVDADDVRRMAEAIAEAQAARVAHAVRQVLDTLPAAPDGMVLSGRGEFLARRAIGRLGLTTPCVSLGQHLGAGLSVAATAHALAVLAREDGLA